MLEKKYRPAGLSTAILGCYIVVCFFSGNISISIIDPQGRQELSKEIPSASSTLSVAHLPKGMYLIRPQYNGITDTCKFVKDQLKKPPRTGAAFLSASFWILFLQQLHQSSTS